jgi:hypothetical protein
LGIAEAIDEQMAPAVQGANLSVDTRIKAMLIQILTDRKALYRMEEWFAKQDVELLLGPGITAKQLNDDALSRALDHLHRIDSDTLFSCLVTRFFRTKAPSLFTYGHNLRLPLRDL